MGWTTKHGVPWTPPGLTSLLHLPAPSGAVLGLSIAVLAQLIKPATHGREGVPWRGAIHRCYPPETFVALDSAHEFGWVWLSYVCIIERLNFRTIGYHLWPYISLLVGEVSFQVGKTPFTAPTEPCSKCLTSWHQVRKCLRDCWRFAYACTGFAYAHILVLLTPQPATAGPLAEHEHKGLERGSTGSPRVTRTEDISGYQLRASPLGTAGEGLHHLLQFRPTVNIQCSETHCMSNQRVLWSQTHGK